MANDDGKEAKKVVVTRSPILIIWQCVIHALPISTTLAILYVVFKGIYIGVDFPGMTNSDTIVLMMLQLSAKLHEIMIVASLSQVVWHAVRHELLYGDGLPLGLVGSGLGFSSFEFYLKKDFYGSLKYIKDHSLRPRRIGFVVLLVVCGLVAILAGPASAVMLVPKAETYPAGGTSIYLNGSDTDFWPEDLSNNLEHLQMLCSGFSATLLDVCPAGGFASLWERWSNVDYRNPLGNRVPTFANDLSGSRFYWPIHGPTTRMPPLYVLGNPRAEIEEIQPYTWLVQTHAASAVLLERVSRDWWKVLLAGINKISTQINDRSVKASARSSFAAVRCTGAQNVSSNSGSFLFPRVRGRWDWAEDLNLDVHSVNASSTDFLRFQWVRLPDEFGVVSIGGLLELPPPANAESRVVVGCTAQTGWVPTTVRTDSYVFWSGWYPFGIFFGERTPAWTAVGPDQVLAPTNGRINLDEAWLDYLTPEAPILPASSQSASASTIEVILAAAGVGDVSFSSDVTQADAWTSQDMETGGGRRRLLESIVANVLTDGLSRCGSHRAFQDAQNVSNSELTLYGPQPDFEHRILKDTNALQVPDTRQEPYSTLRVSMLISGYAFQSSLPAYLAMSVLLTHVALASAHVILLLMHRRVSRSWDSIAELMALAYNSTPTHSLDHTGAGIGRRSTFAKIAYIRVDSRSVGTPCDRLHLIFAQHKDQDSHAAARQGAHGSEELESLPGISAESPSISTSVPQAWTFPISNRKGKARLFDKTYSDSDSAEHLISQQYPDEQFYKLVEVERLYS